MTMLRRTMRRYGNFLSFALVGLPETAGWRARRHPLSAAVSAAVCVALTAVLSFKLSMALCSLISSEVSAAAENSCPLSSGAYYKLRAYDELLRRGVDRSAVFGRVRRVLRTEMADKSRTISVILEMRVNHCLNLFGKYGMTAFRRGEDNRRLFECPHFGGGLFGLMFLVLSIVVFSAVTLVAWGLDGMRGAAGWSWARALPFSPRNLFFGAVMSTIAGSPLSAAVLGGFIAAWYFASGFGWRVFPFTIAATAASAAASALIRVLATALTPPSRIRHRAVLAVMIGLGMLLLLIFITPVMGTPSPLMDWICSLPPRVVEVSDRIFLAWGGAVPSLAAALLAVAAMGLAMLHPPRLDLTGDGIARVDYNPSLPLSIGRGESRLFFRDRHRLAMIHAPLMALLAVWLIWGDGFHLDYTIVAETAFLAGINALIFHGLDEELISSGSLWLIRSLPISAGAVLFRRILHRCLTAMPPAVLVLTAGGFVCRDRFDAGMSMSFIMSFGGVFAFAFIAGSLRMLAAARLFRRNAVRGAFLIMAFFYCLGIWEDSPQNKLVVVVVVAFLTCALWQKGKRAVMDLSAVDIVGSGVSLMDGLVIAGMFFILQGAAQSLMSGSEMLAETRMFVSFNIGGALTIAYALFRLRPRPLAALGIIVCGWPRRLLGDAAWGTAFGLAAALSGCVFLLTAEYWLGIRPIGDGADMFGDFTLRHRLMIGILALAGAPVVEEFVFRGVVYAGLRGELPVWGTVVSAAALFAGIHPLNSIIPVFLMGVMAGLARHRRRSLLPPVIVHSIYNAAMILVQS